MASAEHLPKRPTWDCLACSKQWPCYPAREALTAEHVNDQLALAMLMWSYFESYAVDAGPGPLGEARERFLDWTRRSARRR
jgi:hypothetical protein